MARKVDFTAHKNTVERRRAKGLRDQAVKACSEIMQDNTVRAYAIIAICDDGRARAAWDTGAIIPMWAFPSTVERVLDGDMDFSIEDFRAPMQGNFKAARK